MKHKFKPGTIVDLRPYNLNIRGKIKNKLTHSDKNIYKIEYYSKSFKNFIYISFYEQDMKLNEDQLDDFF